MILVTGATGHTGSRLVNRLLECGEKVRIITREPLRMPVEIRKKLSVVRGDITNVRDAIDAVSGCDAIVAMTHIKLAPHVLEAARTANVQRAIFTSSTRRFTKFPEETARQVIAGEEAVRRSGLEYTIMRCSMIYGGAHDKNIERLVDALKRYPIHPLPGGGTMRWQPVFTWDVVEAVVTALNRPATGGCEYTLAGPAPITYREMVTTILKQLNRHVVLLPVPLNLLKSSVRFLEKLGVNSPVKLDQLERLEEDKVFDIEEARTDLDFNPVSFEEGIRRKLAGTA